MWHGLVGLAAIGVLLAHIPLIGMRKVYVVDGFKDASGGEGFVASSPAPVTYAHSLDTAAADHVAHDAGTTGGDAPLLAHQGEPEPVESSLGGAPWNPSA